MEGKKSDFSVLLQNPQTGVCIIIPSEDKQTAAALLGRL